MKFLYANRIAVMWRHICGYAVCICLVKRTPGLHGLSTSVHSLKHSGVIDMKAKLADKVKPDRK